MGDHVGREMLEFIGGDLCLRWCMILLSSLVVMGGKEGSRMSMLDWGSGWRESELAAMLFVKSSMFSW